jgi:large subunit ribosomal protein L15
MRVDELEPSRGSKKAKRRVGRGIGGHGGKTAGRGTKGQHARNTVARGFEGGQMPLKQRVPKMKGFNNPFRVEYQGINLDVLQALATEHGLDAVTPATLHEHGLVHKGALVKVLARGELTAKVRVSAHGFSKAAEAAIGSAGGSTETIPLPFKSGRPPAKGNQFTNR